MSSEAEDPVAWLRGQVQADLDAARAAVVQGTPSATWTPRMHPSDHVMIRDGNGEAVVYDEGVPTEEQAAHIVRHGPLDAIPDCEAKLAIIDRCEALLPPGPEDLDESYQDGRDPDEQMRDEALAGLAWDILSDLADGYRHRPGWAGNWACLSCGRALRDLPDGHCWERSTPLDLQTGLLGDSGPWTCRDITPMSPEEFMRSGTVELG